MRQINILKTRSIASIVGITGITVILSSVPSLSEIFQYDRAAISNGEIWRIFTCHFTHCSINHLAWDLIALILLYIFCNQLKIKQSALCIALSAILIPISIFVLEPELIYYRGLSGIDSALYIFLICNLVQLTIKIDDKSGTFCLILFIIGFIGKICYELSTHQTLFVKPTIDSNMITVPIAHISGAFVGFSMSLYCKQ